MPQAVWTGTISFGLVNIPVRLYPATEPKDVRFHLYDRRSGRRVRYERVVREYEPPAYAPEPERDEPARDERAGTSRAIGDARRETEPSPFDVGAPPLPEPQSERIA